MQMCLVCIKVNVSVKHGDLNQQGGHYANQDFNLNENSCTLNLLHVEFPSAEQEECRDGVHLAMGVACVHCHYYSV